jgi:hypothetical protein
VSLYKRYLARSADGLGFLIPSPPAELGYKIAR